MNLEVCSSLFRSITIVILKDVSFCASKVLATSVISLASYLLLKRKLFLQNLDVNLK